MNKNNLDEQMKNLSDRVAKLKEKLFIKENERNKRSIKKRL